MVMNVFKAMAYNEQDLRQLGIWSFVRPLPMLKSTNKFEFKRKHSQRTGSVAKIAGGLRFVQPIAKDD